HPPRPERRRRACPEPRRTSTLLGATLSLSKGRRAAGGFERFAELRGGEARGRDPRRGGEMLPHGRANLVVGPATVVFGSDVQRAQAFERRAMVQPRLARRTATGRARATAQEGQDHERGRRERYDDQRESDRAGAREPRTSWRRRPAVAQVVRGLLRQ